MALPLRTVFSRVDDEFIFKLPNGLKFIPDAIRLASVGTGDSVHLIDEAGGRTFRVRWLTTSNTVLVTDSDVRGDYSQMDAVVAQSGHTRFAELQQVEPDFTELGKFLSLRGSDSSTSQNDAFPASIIASCQELAGYLKQFGYSDHRVFV